MKKNLKWLFDVKIPSLDISLLIRTAALVTEFSIRVSYIQDFSFLLVYNQLQTVKHQRPQTMEQLPLMAL